MKTKLYTEKCIACNGRGTEQKFDKSLNHWTDSDITCKYCKGNKVRQYILYINGVDFLYKKLYIRMTD